MSRLDITLKQILQQENVIDAKITEKCNDKGEGYLGEVNTVECCGTNKKLGLIVKKSHTSDKLREQLPVHDVFDVEIFYYETIFPNFHNFQMEHKLSDCFNSVAKYMASCLKDKEEFIILEDLRYKNYEMHDRTEQMNNEHIRFVLKEYGKFHGISYAMKALNRKRFDALASNVKNAMEKLWIMTKLDNLLKDTMENLKVLFDEDKDRLVYDKFVNLFENSSDVVKDIRNVDKFAVITHGDCWSNNMMFKYEDGSNKTEPISMKLIDFQLGVIGSPTRDLSYFIYTCASKNVLDNLKDYLKIYHESLNNFLSYFNLNINNILTFDELWMQWKMYSKFGVLMSSFVTKLMLSDKDEAPNLEEVAENSGDIAKSLNFTSKKNDQYMNRMKDLFDHYFHI